MYRFNEAYKLNTSFSTKIKKFTLKLKASNLQIMKQTNLGQGFGRESRKTSDK